FRSSSACATRHCGKKNSTKSSRTPEAGAANPKFAQQLLRVRLRTSGSKRHQNYSVASVLRFRSSLWSVQQTQANFGIGTLSYAPPQKREDERAPARRSAPDSPAM